MPKYVDSYIYPIPKNKIAAYKKIAKVACKVWKDHGALEYRECIGDDLTPGIGIPFPKIIKAKPTETLVFAYIVYKSRADRDRINAKSMKDPRLAKMMDPRNVPFDTKRMSWGGFTTIIER